MYNVLSEKDFEASIMKKADAYDDWKKQEQDSKRIKSCIDLVVSFSETATNKPYARYQIDEMVKIAQDLENYTDIIPFTLYMMMSDRGATYHEVYHGYHQFMTSVNRVIENHRKALGNTLAPKNFKAMNKVAPEGTVSEIAEKYGISKSEVRRLKKEGALHTLDQKTD